MKISVLAIIFVVTSVYTDGTVEDLIKQSGDSLELTCETTANAGNPSPWKFNGNTIDADVDGSTNNYKYTISRSNLTQNDSGLYECSSASGQQIVAKTLTVISIVGANATVAGNETTAQFSCKVDRLSIAVESIKWVRKETEVTNETEGYNVVQEPMMSTLTIDPIAADSAGLYVCVVKLENITREFQHISSLNTKPVVAPIKKLRSRVEDEEATIECKVTGFPVPKITWLLKREEAEKFEQVKLDERVMTDVNSDNVTDGKLIIKELKINSDRGKYMCKAENEVGSNSTIVVLKVKDKLAAVWPFLGIVAEVAILCCIIFIFEKRRSRKMEEEEEVDAVKQDLMNHANGGDDKEIRQRNNAVKT